MNILINAHGSQHMVWLGFHIDLGKGIISVPESKITILKAQLAHAVVANQLRARQLASIIGKIIASSGTS